MAFAVRDLTPPSLSSSKWELISLETFTPGFRSDKASTGFRGSNHHRYPMSLSLNVVNRLCGDSSPAAKAFLAQMVVAFQNAVTSDIPLTAVTTLVATHPLLMLIPSGITVSFTIS
ncbi:hypothetical protein J4734_16225 [Klebsiella pneumoniae]|uniref:Uncharacterized protein n=1 Tax=Klebsiella pneumoniae TaxID=573 RepID=A0A939NRA5_KLEPN|nr:hypothetical protein [Klebsiella pneumoniae]